MIKDKQFPLVSIIIPCYNRANYVVETLKCVSGINYCNFECVIVDNCSTDDSVKLIEDYIRLDNRFCLLTGNENNVSSSRNRAIRYSKGKYILPLDSDDLIHPDYILKAVEILEADDEIAVVTCNAKFFGAKKGKWNLPEFQFSSFIINNSIHNSSIFRRLDFDRVNGYKTDFIVRQDWEFWINILKSKKKVVRIPAYYFYYRKHQHSIQKTYRNSTEVDRSFQLIYHYHSDLYDPLLSNPILLLKNFHKYKNGYNLLRRLTFRKTIE